MCLCREQDASELKAPLGEFDEEELQQAILLSLEDRELNVAEAHLMDVEDEELHQAILLSLQTSR